MLKRILVAACLAGTLAGCIIAPPPRPGPRAHFVPGHYNERGFWVPGHAA